MYHQAPGLQSEDIAPLKSTVKRLWQEEQFVEYGLLLLLISLAAIADVLALARAIGNAFGSAAQNLSIS